MRGEVGVEERRGWGGSNMATSCKRMEGSTLAN